MCLKFGIFLIFCRLGGTCGSDNGSVVRQQMNSYVESLKKQIESLEDSVRDKNRRYEDEAGKFEAQKRRMLDEFDREKQTMKQCFEREKSDLERRLMNLESGMRGDAVDGRRLSFKFYYIISRFSS